MSNDSIGDNSANKDFSSALRSSQMAVFAFVLHCRDRGEYAEIEAKARIRREKPQRGGSGNCGCLAGCVTSASWSLRQVLLAVLNQPIRSYSGNKAVGRWRGGKGLFSGDLYP